MKRLLLSTLIAVFSLSSLGYANEIKVYLEGQELNLSAAPVIDNGTSLVPFRGIFEALGLEVSWEAETQTVSGKNADTSIEFNIGNSFALVNGKEKQLAVPSKIISGNTVVPLRFVAEAVGEKVEWNAEKREIYIGNILPVTTSTTVDNVDKTDEISLLYTIDGTGEYEGYRRLMGFPKDNEAAVYFQYTQKGSIVSSIIKTDDIRNLNPNEKFQWSYNGMTITSTRQELYGFFSDTSSLSSIIGKESNYDVLSPGWLKATFGSVYDEWFYINAVYSECISLAERFINRETGTEINRFSTFNIDREKLADYLEEEEPNSLDGIVTSEEIAEREEEAVDIEELEGEWISSRRLLNVYRVSANWMGSEIFVSYYEGDEQKQFYIENAPESKFVKGKIYEGSGIKFKYEDGDLQFEVKALMDKGLL